MPPWTRPLRASRELLPGKRYSPCPASTSTPTQSRPASMASWRPANGSGLRSCWPRRQGQMWGERWSSLQENGCLFNPHLLSEPLGSESLSFPLRPDPNSEKQLLQIFHEIKCGLTPAQLDFSSELVAFENNFEGIRLYRDLLSLMMPAKRNRQNLILTNGIDLGIVWMGFKILCICTAFL